MKKLLAFTCIIAISCGLYSQESINKAQFIEKVWDFENDKDAIKLKSKVPVILDFYADWCRPCKMLEPELTALQKDYKGKLLWKEDKDDKNPPLYYFSKMVPARGLTDFIDFFGDHAKQIR